MAQLLAEARRALDHAIRTTWVVGEVDSLNHHKASGHYYFQLKDERAVVRAVMWRTDAQALKFRLEPGQKLLVRGHFDVYDRAGSFQLIVKHAEPAGLGADALARKQLEARLRAEGLFDPATKRALPLVPRAIGVVTSKSGAALHDVVRAVQRRFPVPIFVADCRVQGEGAPASIARALALVARAEVDVVIIGRGGGSATDLAAFDDEVVVRAVAACPIPTISAVGHEVDTSLTDLVADHRAATPTMAGEMAVPVWSDLYEQLGVLESRARRELDHVVRGARQELGEACARADRRMDAVVADRRRALGEARQRLTAAHPRAQLVAHRAATEQLRGRARAALVDAVGRRRRALGELERRLAARPPGALIAARGAALTGLEARARAAQLAALDRRRRGFGELIGRLDALSPLAVLERGYAIATRGAQVVTRAAQLAPGDPLSVRLGRGVVDCQVVAVREDAS